ncbi:ABC transporter substrate-binding protein [Streptomyces sp. NPDC127112]|uniref:ABC transporter substrate-binding protein n=1 Tax=unclassified Streptomyces TaxID=2593676 RepID=UPI003639A16D
MPLPQGIEFLIEQFDTFAANRGSGRRLPVMFLKRDPAPPGFVHASTPETVVREYEDRLIDDERDPAADLLAHAVIEDGPQAPPGAVPGTTAEDMIARHVALLDAIADQFETSMPPDAGELRLPRYHTCRDALDVTVGAGSAGSKRRKLRDELYLRLLLRRPMLATLARVAGATGDSFLTNIWLTLFQLLVVGLPRRVYGLWLSRRRTLRWVGSRRPKGANFLRMALTVTPSGSSRGNHALIRRMLLMALLNDLSRAASPSRFWIRRARRRWSFVLLLPKVGEEGTPVRQLLDTYADVIRTEPPAPLLVLGALTGEAPSYAQALAADPHSATGLADRVHELYARSSPSAAYVVPLSEADDDGPAASWVTTNPKVPVRANGRGDYVRAAAAPAMALALVAVGLYVFGPGTRPSPSCHKVATGETVGVTDGKECHLGAAGRDKELLDLEAVAAKQNGEALTSGRPYRTVVFFAPLTGEPGDSTPVSIQNLRGALAAQNLINSRSGDVVQIRLLIANPGKYFAYGSQNAQGPDVAKEIIERKDRDRIAAVVGITQSRQSSFAAVGEISAASIPVIGNSVTGSRMVDERSSTYYFQVSPSNDRIAEVMADFAAHSEQIGELTTDKGDGRTAVVVYDPDDEFFSADLRSRFSAHYQGGKTVTVPYYENRNGQIVADVARDICDKVQASGGYVVYAGRSGKMPELLDALQETTECRKADGKQVALFAESVAAVYLQDPHELLTKHAMFKPYYVMLNDSSGNASPNTPYSEFTSRFREVFGKDAVPEGNAAGAYDALRVASEVINSVYAQYKTVENGSARFKPTDVYARLSNPGVQNFPGASGLLSLDSRHKYPPNKAVYVMEPHLDKSVTTWLACGLLPDQPPGRNDPATWGLPGKTHPCPR